MVEHSVPLTTEADSDGLAVIRTDSGETVLFQHAGRGRRPFIHPIQAPGGAGVLTENAPSHHPWQHGLYVGLNDANGSGFWSEGLDPRRADIDGTFDSRLDDGVEHDGGVARWTVLTDYLARGGAPVFDDRQDWALRATDDRLELDMTWTLRAAQDVTFGEYAYGGLFLRMPFRRESGGSAFNSEGRHEDGLRSRWVAVQMPLPDSGQEVLAAMLDHPHNPGSPVPWRIDDELGICPSPSAAGAWTLAGGVPVTFRYRLVVFAAPVVAEVVDGTWQRFVEETA